MHMSWVPIGTGYFGVSTNEKVSQSDKEQIERAFRTAFEIPDEAIRIRTESETEKKSHVTPRRTR